MKITRKQLSLVHVGEARLGLCDEDYRAILMRAAGVTSSKDLDPVGFEQVMDAFHALGFESDFSRANLGHRAGMATAPQVAMIRGLWDDYTGGEGTDFSLGKWLERTFKVSSVRFVPRETAGKAITALLAMKAKKTAKASAPAD